MAASNLAPPPSPRIAFICSLIARHRLSDLSFPSSSSSHRLLQAEGVSKIHPIGPVSDFEKAGLDKMSSELKGSIEKGAAFAKAWKATA